MRLAWEVARRGFRRYATYRWATVAGVFTNTVFGFIRAYVFVAVFGVVGTISGYSLSDTLTYTFVSQGLLMPVYLWGWEEIAETVRSGQIATDLYRPLDFQLYWLAQDLGRAAYHFLARGVPPFVVGALFFELRLPQRPETWVLFALSVGLAVTVSFAMRFMTNVTAFWLVNQRGVNGLAATAWTVLSGFTIPIAFFPDAARSVIRMLPFVSLFEMPLDVFLERATGVDLLQTIAAQAAWAVVLLLAGRAMLSAGARKLVVQGG